jgi:hypothetical protein
LCRDTVEVDSRCAGKAKALNGHRRAHRTAGWSERLDDRVNAARVHGARHAPYNGRIANSRQHQFLSRRIHLKPLLGAFLLCVSFACSRPAAANTWPQSCGEENINFDVKTQKHQPPPAAPAEGKAQIIFIQIENQMVAPFQNATVRFGMDGAWVGANNGNSYFAFTVDPGLHHLCANWQSAWKRLNKNLDLTSFTAESGQVYYYAAQVTVNSQNSVSFGLSQLNPDEGEYRVENFKLSTAKAK